MNELFVNVKVDREERPDVDSIYMDAVQAMTGRGGWPMTVFTTPKGEPFYGGTYFPKPQFLQLLGAIDDVWRNRPGDVSQNVGALGEAIDRTRTVAPVADCPTRHSWSSACANSPSSTTPSGAASAARRSSPPRSSLELVMREAVLRQGADARAACHQLARAMAAAASTTTSVAASPATRPIGSGWCRTSRRCSTTRRCWHGSTSAHRSRSTTPRTARWPARPSTTCCATSAIPMAGSSPPRTPTRSTPTATRTRVLFHTWTVDEVRARSAPTPTCLARVVRVHRRRGRQLRGPHHPDPPLAPGRARPAGRTSSVPGPRCSRTDRRALGPVSTTRCSPSGTR
jgi:hypothetical protein